MLRAPLWSPPCVSPRRSSSYRLYLNLDSMTLHPSCRTAVVGILAAFSANLVLTAFYHVTCSHPPLYHLASAVDLVGISFPGIAVGIMVRASPPSRVPAIEHA